MVYRPIDDDFARFADRLQIEGRWYVPYRRHLTAPALRAELKQSGFSIQRSESDKYGAIKIIAVST
ncbi:MAG TPA: hypothetical protein ENI23_18070 [bacterium]|nr:hypothetical protein [bacterium]